MINFKNLPRYKKKKKHPLSFKSKTKNTFPIIYFEISNPTIETKYFCTIRKYNHPSCSPITGDSLARRSGEKEGRKKKRKKKRIFLQQSTLNETRQCNKKTVVWQKKKKEKKKKGSHSLRKTGPECGRCTVNK